MKSVEIQEDELKKLYIDEGKSMQEIAVIFKCTHPTVRARMREYGIPARPATKVRKRREEKVIIPGEPINCNTQGKKCVYRTKKCDSNKYLCDYFFKTGRIRGCDPEKCTAYSLK